MRRTTQELYAYSCLDACVLQLSELQGALIDEGAADYAHSAGECLQLLRIVGEILTDPALDR